MIYLTSKISGGRMVSDNEDAKEYWTAIPRGQAPWFMRAIRNPRELFHPSDNNFGAEQNMEKSAGSRTGSYRASTPDSIAHEKGQMNGVVEEVGVAHGQGYAHKGPEYPQASYAGPSRGELRD